ncbi:MAG TPA: hypothetical protein VFR24_27710 [Candidatus Angelobacter sp.]|nr:hypothetical protein [Candidatus Angelobacter sp.]
MNWQPIETAPHDGSKQILAVVKSKAVNGIKPNMPYNILAIRWDDRKHKRLWIVSRLTTGEYVTIEENRIIAWAPCPDLPWHLIDLEAAQ